MSDSIFAKRSPVPDNAPGRLPARPTDALPGTPEKLAVMHERAKRGETLFHPDDAQWEKGSLPIGARLLLEAA